MARKTTEFTVGGELYRITQLGAEAGSELYDDIIAAMGPKLAEKFQDAQLAKRVGDAIARLTGDGNAVTDAAKLELVTSFAPLVVELMAAVPKELKRRWRALFLGTTELQTGPVWLNMAEAKLFNDHFAGRMGTMQAWEFACLKHNFLDFLSSKVSSESSDAGR